MTVSPPFKAAILVNSPGSSDIDLAFRTAFETRITDASPGAQVDFFDPIDAQTYPKPGLYDLIVLTGGGGEHDADAQDVPWIEALKAFVRKVAEEGRQKIVAVCWGHQVVHVAFGGTIGPLKDGGSEVGVTPIELTPAGVDFFTSSPPLKDRLNIHQFHEREVKTPGEGFVALAEGNQCLLNSTNTILTVQGHPEMDAELSKQLLNVSSRNTGGAEDTRRELEERIERLHDGRLVWERIVAWARA